MALLPNNKNIKAKDINIHEDHELSYSENKKSNNKNRKTLKVSEEAQNKIKIISYIKDIPMYEVINSALDSYVEKLTDREKSIYELQNKQDK